MPQSVSVCPSVYLSVCPSVRDVEVGYVCHTGWNTSKIISRQIKIYAPAYPNVGNFMQRENPQNKGEFVLVLVYWS